MDERLYILAPALIPVAYILLGFAYYCFLHWTGRAPQVEGADRRSRKDFFGPFILGFTLWIIRPLERAFLAGKVSPNVLTVCSLLSCCVSGTAIATNHMATAAWAYIVAGIFDILDGRLARRTNQSSQAGAFLDSVSDRWGELVVFCGFAWFLRDSAWLAAVMLAVAGSMMVSYTRARGEGLGIKLAGGLMQRAERIALVSVGTLLTAWFDAASDTAEYGPHVIGVALLLTGVGSSATAIGRWYRGYKILKEREQTAAQAAEEAAKDSAKARTSARRA